MTLTHIFDYEHFNPDFNDAQAHTAEGITLLRMQCNQKRARGRLSRESVVEADRNPACLRDGFASESFDFSPSEPVEVAIGVFSFVDSPLILEVNGVSLLSIKEPEGPRQPYRLSGKFYDVDGALTLSITDNVFSVKANYWDVECVGPRLTVRRGPGMIALIVKSEPPTRLVIERLDMQFKGVRVVADVTSVKFSVDQGRSWIPFFSGRVVGAMEPVFR